MIDEAAVDLFIKMICDRYSPEELIELLGVSTADICQRFYDEVLELDIDG